MMVTLPDYEIKRVLGSGSFGYVFEAYDHKNNRTVALKRIEKVGNSLSREYEILFDIKNCDHVVKILDFYYSRNNQNKLIQNIVFEYMDDNLEHMIQEKVRAIQSFTEMEIKLYIYQIFKGLEYIHSKNIVHRDLKPENILVKKVNDSAVVKICDFGSSKYIDPAGKNTPYIVSRYYRAPELILCITMYGPAIDIWATGCILAEMITKEPLFQGKTEGDQLFTIFGVLGSPSEKEYEILGTKVPFDPKLFQEFPKIAKNTEQNDRLEKKVSHFKDKRNLLDLLNRIFTYIPEERVTAREALNHPFFNDIRQYYAGMALH